VVVGAVVGLVAGPIGGAIGATVLAGAIWAWLRGGAYRRAVAALGGEPADPKLHARFYNLVEGLALVAGVRVPQLRVLDSDGLNLGVAAGRSGRSTVVATRGLLAELDRVELEAVVAEAVMLLRREEAVGATLLAGTFGLGSMVVLDQEHDSRADLEAVRLTRYPPALASALEKLMTKGTSVPSCPAYAAVLWLADPRRPESPPWPRLPLEARIEALRQL